MSQCDVLVVLPFRRPTFRLALAPSFPVEEPWDSPGLQVAGELEKAGLSVRYLSLLNTLPAFNPATQGELLRDVLRSNPCRLLLFVSDDYIASNSTAGIYGMCVVGGHYSAADCRPVVGVAGRIATTLRHSLFSHVPSLDFVVVGECAAVIGQIVRTILENGAEPKLSHVLWRSASGDPPDGSAIVLDPNALALPAFHLLEPSFALLGRATNRKPEGLPFSIRTTFGCLFQCRFCAGVPYWNMYRRKSPERVAAEIDHLALCTGSATRLSFFEDEIFTSSEDHVQAVAEVLASRQIVLDGLYTHSALLTPTIAQLLKPVARRVFLGMETANDGLLRSMKKGQSMDGMLRTLETTRAAELEVHLEWVLGTPGETVETLIDSLWTMGLLLSSRLVSSANSYVFCPHPGTEFAEDPSRFGFRVSGSFDEMLESGGYPTAELSTLTRNQVYVAYLMSQCMISEAARVPMTGPWLEPPNREALRRLFEQVGFEATMSGKAPTSSEVS